MSLLQVGDVIDGKYRIERQVAEGGMGAVYEALHTSIGRRVAIKTLLPMLPRAAEMEHRLLNEARAVNKIPHQGVVQIADCGWLPSDSLYLVMEFLDGEDLYRRMEFSGHKCAEDEVLKIGWQLADVLSAAHEVGVVHRDLKPQNVMLIPDHWLPGGERLKLLDFGVAKLMREQASITISAETFGTVSYMAPEQCISAKNVDGKADVYSLGVMLFELLAGCPPFGDDQTQPLALMRMHVYAQPRSLRDLTPGVSAALCDLVHRLLEKQREQRPSMPEIASELEAISRRRGGLPYRFFRRQPDAEYKQLTEAPPTDIVVSHCSDDLAPLTQDSTGFEIQVTTLEPVEDSNEE